MLNLILSVPLWLWLWWVACAAYGYVRFLRWLERRYPG